MEIKEMRARKREAEEAIVKILERLQSETGGYVKSVQVSALDVDNFDSVAPRLFTVSIVLAV